MWIWMNSFYYMLGSSSLQWLAEPLLREGGKGKGFIACVACLFFCSILRAGLGPNGFRGPAENTRHRNWGYFKMWTSWLVSFCITNWGPPSGEPRPSFPPREQCFFVYRGYLALQHWIGLRWEVNILGSRYQLSRGRCLASLSLSRC